MFKSAKSSTSNLDLLPLLDTFERRHVGPSSADIQNMLEALDIDSLDTLIDQTVPANIRLQNRLNLPPALSETEALADMRALADQNKVFRSFIGLGYNDTIVPGVIQRNILENPGWYTQYTPYQAEIAQGRLEALVNFQTMVMDLTGMDIANSSLLDEATAATEAMTMAHRAQKRGSTANTFFMSATCHPHVIHTVVTRAEPLGIKVVVGDHRSFDCADTFGVMVNYPASNGDILDYSDFVEKAHAVKALVVVSADLLALTLLTPPGEWGADIVIGNTQRFGVPFGYGGPHAAYMATREKFQRSMPGRIIGVSKDAHGNPAMRLALQTREQHIRRDRATSNICTAQVLLAIMASMYAVYHGPFGLEQIAKRTNLLTRTLAAGLESLEFTLNDAPVFDTLTVNTGDKTAAIQAQALAHEINLHYSAETISLSLDERTTVAEIATLLTIFGAETSDVEALAAGVELDFGRFQRQSDYLTQHVFNSYHSETEMLRYIKRLESRDLSLAFSMIALGSCTMKLNATTEMIPVTWPEFASIHPFAPLEQTQGYQELFKRLGDALVEITGFNDISFQPNAGSQGEYTGLLTIRAFHKSNGDDNRNICLIPSSAHGTNPASAVMAGMKVVVTKCDDEGNVDVADLREKAEKHSANLAAIMVTYPSTHGVFEDSIVEICNLIHAHGGQVYLDGANMNAMVGLCRPGDIGADVCHLNLHKTFCIPHGGGGPGMGPICVAEHLAPFLPNHALVEMGGSQAPGSVSSAPWGSPSILPISYAYIVMMGAEGLTNATKIAILSANYMAHRLDAHFPVLYRGENGRVAHECIIDLRPLKEATGVTTDDVAKRLIDFGFHAPTMSWPVAGTLMIEPTESESLAELDRFCNAMIAIREESRLIEDGTVTHEASVLANAPHTAAVVLAEEWDASYSREQAAFPAAWVRDSKFWPAVGRVDNVFGDRNLVCSCEPLESYQ